MTASKFSPGCGQITVWFRDNVVVVSGGFFLVVVPRVPHHMRPSRFLSRLCEAGPPLQPKGGEHIYLSFRRSIDPGGSALNRGMSPAVIFRVVRYCFLCSCMHIGCVVSGSLWRYKPVAASLGIHQAVGFPSKRRRRRSSPDIPGLLICCDEAIGFSRIACYMVC